MEEPLCDILARIRADHRHLAAACEEAAQNELRWRREVYDAMPPKDAFEADPGPDWDGWGYQAHAGAAVDGSKVFCRRCAPEFDTRDWVRLHLRAAPLHWSDLACSTCGAERTVD